MDREACVGYGDVVMAKIVRGVSFAERGAGRAADGRRFRDHYALDEARAVRSSSAPDAGLYAVSRAGDEERKDVRRPVARDFDVPQLSSGGRGSRGGELRRVSSLSRSIEIKIGKWGDDDQRG